MASRALHKAVVAGRLKQSRLLIEAGAPMEYNDECGQTVLIKAVLLVDDKTRIKMVHLLLEKGASTEHMDSLNRTALSWACMFGREPEVTMILEFDNDLNGRDINGQTALYHAVTSGNVAVVKKVVLALKKFDLCVDIGDNNGVTPLMQAVRLGHDLCASVLTFQGDAKVGKSMHYPEDFISAQKWATSTLRHRDRLNSRKAQFPPIAANKAFVTMKCSARSSSNSGVSIRQTSMRSQSPFLQNSDSAASDDEFSSDDFEEYLYSSEVNNQSLKYMPLDTFIQSLETCASTVSLSSIFDEVDAYSTIVDTKKLPKYEDLSQMFNIVQDQLSPSYRDTARNICEDALCSVVNTSQTSLNSLSSDISSCSSIRRKGLQTGQKRELPFINSLVEVETVREDKDSASLLTAKKICFPVLPQKVNLIQTKSNV